MTSKKPSIGKSAALRLEGGCVDLVALAEDLLEELLLRREVVQEPGLAEPDGVGELAHRGARDSRSGR